MARGFGTSGGGAGDKITTAFTSGLDAGVRSYALWVYRISNGGTALGRMFSKRTVSASEVEQLYDNGGVTYDYSAQWTTVANWNFPIPSITTWHHIVITYDPSSTANAPVVYVDGVSATVTNTVAPTGTLVTNTDPYVLGNRGNDNLRNWDGRLAEFAVWNAILDAAEAKALGSGVSPLLVRKSKLVEYIPMLRDNVSRLGAAPTITGALVQNHPRVIYGQARQRRYNAVLVPPTSGGGAVSIDQSGVLIG